MKVCTDSCLFGAWIPSVKGGQVLDIGTGTGLLTLMLAQRSSPETHFTALDIDPLALHDAKTNFSNAPWHKQITCIEADGLVWAEQNTCIFDVIICNPPFFEKHLKGPDAHKNSALHAGALHAAALAKIIKQLLKKEGRAFVLYPPHEAGTFEAEALQHHLYAMTNTTVHNRVGDKPFRQMLEIGHEKAQTKQDSIAIRVGNEYSPAFVNLLKSYYLAL